MCACVRVHSLLVLLLLNQHLLQRVLVVYRFGLDGLHLTKPKKDGKITGHKNAKYTQNKVLFLL